MWQAALLDAAVVGRGDASLHYGSIAKRISRIRQR